MATDNIDSAVRGSGSGNIPAYLDVTPPEKPDAVGGRSVTAAVSQGVRARTSLDGNAAAAERLRAELIARIRAHTAHVGVVGLGYVGLPFAVEKAKVGFPVTGIEQNPLRAAAVNRGENYIPDVKDVELAQLVRDGRLRAVTTFDVVPELDVIVICVPTPLTKNLTPDLQYIEHVTREISRRLRPGQLISLESTTYPGTTDGVMRPILEAGRLAPSALYRQPWHFIVVRDRQRLAELADACHTGRFVGHGALAVVVAADPPNRFREIDGARAVQKMELAAWDQGVGMCWIAGFDGARVAQLVELPDQWQVLTVLAFGYPADAGRPRRKGVKEAFDEVVSWERFGQGG